MIIYVLKAKEVTLDFRAVIFLNENENKNKNYYGIVQSQFHIVVSTCANFLFSLLFSLHTLSNY